MGTVSQIASIAAPSLTSEGQVLLAALAGLAALWDLRRRRIPNWLVLAGLILGFAWNIWSAGALGLVHAATGFATGFGLYFPFYLLRARGAGDVKLLAAIGAIAGPANCFWIFVLTAIFGGFIALLLLTSRGGLRTALFNAAWILRDLAHFRAPYRSREDLDVTSGKGFRLPHAPVLAAGTALFLLAIHAASAAG